MVDLSCLIVIAALFSQITTTIPLSANPKAIDYFFFYLIFELSLVFIHHLLLLVFTKYYDKELKEIEKNHNIEVDVDIDEKNKKDSLDFPPGVYFPPNLKEAWNENIIYNSKKARKFAKKAKRTVDYFNWISTVFMIVLNIIGHIGYSIVILINRDKIYKEFYQNN